MRRVVRSARPHAARSSASAANISVSRTSRRSRAAACGNGGEYRGSLLAQPIAAQAQELIGAPARRRAAIASNPQRERRPTARRRTWRCAREKGGAVSAQRTAPSRERTFPPGRGRSCRERRKLAHVGSSRSGARGPARRQSRCGGRSGPAPQEHRWELKERDPTEELEAAAALDSMHYRRCGLRVHQIVAEV